MSRSTKRFVFFRIYLLIYLCLCVYIYIYIYIYIYTHTHTHTYWAIGLMSRVFANGLGDQGSIPG